MSEIPAGWNTSRIGEVADINPGARKDELDDETLASFVPMKCVEAESGRFAPPENKKVGEVKKGYTPMRDGDVIFAKVTPCMENGKAAVVRGLTNGIGFGSTEFYALRPKDNLMSEFLFYYIIQQGFRREAERHMTGAVGLRRVPKAFIEEHDIPLPPLSEQRRIVARIEELFSRLDAGVAALRDAKAQLQRYRQSVLAAAVTGQLTKSDTASWSTETVADVCEIVTDGDHQAPPRATTGIPFLTIGNISSGRLDFSNTRFVPQSYFDEIKNHRIPIPNDVLYSVVGATIGIPVLVKTDRSFCFQRHIALLRPSKRILPKFLHLFMESPQTFRRAWAGTTGSAQPTLPLKALRALPISLPTLAEQHQIVAEVEVRTTAIDHLAAELDRQITHSNRLRQSTLASAFDGRL